MKQMPEEVEGFSPQNTSSPIWKRIVEKLPWRKTTIKTTTEVKATESPSTLPPPSEKAFTLKLPTEPIDLQKPDPLDTLPSEINKSMESHKETRETGIGTRLIASLKEKGVVSETDEFESVGIAAIGGTNESGNPFLFEKIRKHPQAPNGYLIGIGAGNVFSMLEAFPKEVTPKAVILFDIDPKVVQEGQKIIDALKESPDNLPVKKDSFRSDEVFPLIGTANPIGAILKYAKVLHQLAKEGNLVIAQADFTDPRLIDELSLIHDLHNLNNVIYLSNIVDHLWRRQMTLEKREVPNYRFLLPIHGRSPHRNFYIDTLGVSLCYHLRVRPIPAYLSRGDFVGIQNWQTKPTDEIDARRENIVWDDISNWDDGRLARIFKELQDDPYQQYRAREIEEMINRQRKYEVDQYPKTKQKAKEPPEMFGSKPLRVTVPSDPVEEKALLEELKIPYDYYRDYIPFIANNLWGSAKNPGEIKGYMLPKRDNAIWDLETGKIIARKDDPRDWVKGKIELWALESQVTYEELALAKLYREMQERENRRQASNV